EMASLAQTDPQTWIVEQQRAQAVHSVLAQLEHGMTLEQQQATQKQQEEYQREVSRAWGVLGQHGIDKPKLIGIYDKVSSSYGIPKQMLEQLVNPQAVLVMRDALAFRELKEKKA